MSEDQIGAPAHPITDRVRQAMAVTLRHCEELLPQADWLSKLARAEATGTHLRFGLQRTGWNHSTNSGRMWRW